MAVHATRPASVTSRKAILMEDHGWHDAIGKGQGITTRVCLRMCLGNIGDAPINRKMSVTMTEITNP